MKNIASITLLLIFTQLTGLSNYPDRNIFGHTSYGISSFTLRTDTPLEQPTRDFDFRYDVQDNGPQWGGWTWAFDFEWIDNIANTVIDEGTKVGGDKFLSEQQLVFGAPFTPSGGSLTLRVRKKSQNTLYEPDGTYYLKVKKVITANTGSFKNANYYPSGGYTMVDADTSVFDGYDTSTTLRRNNGQSLNTATQSKTESGLYTEDYRQLTNRTQDRSYRGAFATPTATYAERAIPFATYTKGPSIFLRYTYGKQLNTTTISEQNSENDSGSGSTYNSQGDIASEYSFTRSGSFNKTKYGTWLTSQASGGDAEFQTPMTDGTITTYIASFITGPGIGDMSYSFSSGRVYETTFSGSSSNSNYGTTGSSSRDSTTRYADTSRYDYRGNSSEYAKRSSYYSTYTTSQPDDQAPSFNQSGSMHQNYTTTDYYYNPPRVTSTDNTYSWDPISPYLGAGTSTSNTTYDDPTDTRYDEEGQRITSLAAKSAMGVQFIDITGDSRPAATIVKEEFYPNFVKISGFPRRAPGGQGKDFILTHPDQQ